MPFTMFHRYYEEHSLVSKKAKSKSDLWHFKIRKVNENEPNIIQKEGKLAHLVDGSMI